MLFRSNRGVTFRDGEDVYETPSKYSSKKLNHKSLSLVRVAVEKGEAQLIRRAVLQCHNVCMATVVECLRSVT